MNTTKLSLVSIFCALSFGCHTSQVPADYAEKANASLAAQQAAPAQTNSSELKDRLARLWADVPEYVAVIQDERQLKKTPRLVSMSPPAYPTIPLLAGVKGRVLVSIVVGRDGSVIDARVMESSDSRFDQSAVDAAIKWKFLPGEFDDGPTIVVIAAPVEFAGKR